MRAGRDVVAGKSVFSVTAEVRIKEPGSLACIESATCSGSLWSICEAPLCQQRQELQYLPCSAVEFLLYRENKMVERAKTSLSSHNFCELRPSNVLLSKVTAGASKRRIKNLLTPSLSACHGRIFDVCSGGHCKK